MNGFKISKETTDFQGRGRVASPKTRSVSSCHAGGASFRPNPSKDTPLRNDSSPDLRQLLRTEPSSQASGLPRAHVMDQLPQARKVWSLEEANDFASTSPSEAIGPERLSCGPSRESQTPKFGWKATLLNFGASAAEFSKRWAELGPLSAEMHRCHRRVATCGSESAYSYQIWEAFDRCRAEVGFANLAQFRPNMARKRK